MRQKPGGLEVGFGGVADTLLADIAVRVQLSQAAYAKAVQRYEAIRKWVEREDSPLSGRVQLFYPQGSMAIGAAIASRVTDDEYDLDIVVQLRVPPGWSAKDVLDALYEAIRGTPGSRYYGMAKRGPRCITVSYAHMHLDLIPMERRQFTPERESDLFHDSDHSDAGSGRCVVNSYGFAKWFKKQTSQSGPFAVAFAAHARNYEIALFSEADADPVPDQETLTEKSLTVVALQLIKRWRNVQYQHRSTRRPPSVLLSKFATDQAGRSASLSAELLSQAVFMQNQFERAEAARLLIHVPNPACRDDVLSDRWPASREEQREFLGDIKRLIRVLGWLDGEHELNEIKRELAELFGEGPTRKAVESFAEQIGRDIRKGQGRQDRTNGSVVLAGAGGGVVPPRHRFHGILGGRR